MNVDFVEAAARVHDRLRADLARALGQSAIASDDPWCVDGDRLATRIRTIGSENLESVSAFGSQRLGALTGAHAALLSLAQIESWQIDPIEVLASSLGTHLATRICGRQHPGPPHAGPVLQPTVVRCGDGYALLSAPTPEDMLHMARMIGLRGPAELTDDILRAWAAPRRVAELVENAQSWRLPVLARAHTSDLQDCATFKLLDSHIGSDLSRRLAAPRPLAGITVVELGGMWAGPLCGRLLAALGADLIKVEGPKRPDGTRPLDPQTCWGTFAEFNRGKRGLVVDMATERGRASLAAVINTADLVVENFSPRVLPNWGFTYDVLRRRNPNLLMVSLPAFPRDSAQEHYTAYGPGLELASGLAATHPEGDGAPAPSPIAFLDYLAGLAGAIAAIGLLRTRERTRRVGHVEVAQFAVARACAAVLDPAAWSPMNLDCLSVLDNPGLRASGLLTVQPTPSGAPCVHLARPPWQVENWSWSAELPAPAFDARERPARPDLVPA